MLQNNSFQTNNSKNSYELLTDSLKLLVCKNTGEEIPKLTACSAITLLFISSSLYTRIFCLCKFFSLS